MQVYNRINTFNLEFVTWIYIYYYKSKFTMLNRYLVSVYPAMSRQILE
jgi:hypothetical protein